MTSLFIHHAHCITTQNDHASEIFGGSIYIEDGLIKDVMSAEEFILRGEPMLKSAERVIDARHHLVTPGLINCHHHMVQSLTRAVKGVQNAELFSWLKGLYPLWAGLTPEMIGRVAALRLHHQQRPPLHLPQRGQVRRQHPSRPDHGTALHGHPWEHECGSIQGWTSTGQCGGKRSGHIDRLAATDRKLARRAARLHAANCSGTLFAF